MSPVSVADVAAYVVLPVTVTLGDWHAVRHHAEVQRVWRDR